MSVRGGQGELGLSGRDDLGDAHGTPEHAHPRSVGRRDRRSSVEHRGRTAVASEELVERVVVVAGEVERGLVDDDQADGAPVGVGGANVKCGIEGVRADGIVADVAQRRAQERAR